ncbi:MAG: hypothetical protein WDW38_003369 [Sanguina aurantia]
MASTEFDYTFTDRELQEILGIIELKASTGEVQESPGLASLLQAENNLGLQFQPHEVPIGSLPPVFPMNLGSPQFPMNMSAGGSLTDTSLFPPEAGIFGCSPSNVISLPGLGGPQQHRQSSNATPALLSVRDLSLSEHMLAPSAMGAGPASSSRAGIVAAAHQQQQHQQQQQRSRDLLSAAAAASTGQQYTTNNHHPLQRRTSSNANSVSAMASAGAAALSAAYVAAGMQAHGTSGQAGEHMYGMMSSPAADNVSGGGGQSKGSGHQPQDNRPQVSHSTVEKQRRDRINTLIDELRELVPPQKSQSKNDGLEARRPKHVVLADTIALLKSFHNKVRSPQHTVLAVTAGRAHRLWFFLDASSPPRGAAVGHARGSRKLSLDARQSTGGEISSLQVKDEGVQSDTSKGSASSQPCANDDRMEAEMPGGNHPAAPAAGPSGGQQQAMQAAVAGGGSNKVYAEIPMSPSQLNGVTVERGKEAIMYVQVKCRDRRGLLSDIINALRLLPLEIRTAAITTTGDGTVRDVFEIMPDDDALQPAEIQNMVHDALYQHHLLGDLVGKKHRMQESL